MKPKQPKTKLSHFWQIITLLLVNLVIFLILLYGLELYLSLTDPKLSLPPKPVENVNQYRFREREFISPKPAGLCRIMALGDSFTWGKGVWVEERYTSLLEMYLNQTYPYKKFEVLNFGFPGSPTTRERNSLRDYKDLVEPDLVTIGFVLNDPQTNRQRYSVEREQFEKKYQKRLNKAADRLSDFKLDHVGELSLKAIDSFLIASGVIPSWQVALQRTYEKDSKEWLDFEQALRDIKTMSNQMGLPQPIFIVLNQGTRTDRPTDYNNPDKELQLYLSWYHQAEKSAAIMGFNPINYEPEFAKQLANDIIAVTILDGHPSSRVHRIYAQKLFEEIKGYIDTGKMCADDIIIN